MRNVTTTRTSLQTEMNWIGFTMSVETKKTEVVTTETTEVVTKFDLPSSVKDEDARFIAEHGKLTDKGAGPTITLTQKQLDAFFDRKGVTKEEHARVFAAQEAFVEAAFVVAGHGVAEAAKKARAEGLEGENEVFTVKAQSKHLRPMVSVQAAKVNRDPKTEATTTSYARGTVRFNYKGKINPDLLAEMAELSRKALHD